MTKQNIIIQTPVAPLGVTIESDVVVEICWNPVFDDNSQGDMARDVRLQLIEYLAGSRKVFTFPYAACGTPFRMSVWNQLLAIPYGKTMSYAQLAEAIGRPKAFRAVAQACHFNPLAIVVPCHRVIGTDNSLTGYAGGVQVKKFLLDIERSIDNR